MTMFADAREGLEGEPRNEASNPFAEAEPRSEDAPRETVGFAPWTEQFTPFADRIEEATEASTTEAMLAAALAELRDEMFDEAVANLADEVEQFIAERFAGETAASAAEREQLGETHIAGVRFEAEQYLDHLEAGLVGRDIESLSEEQLDELLESLDPTTGELTPAGEQFIGGLIRKAKGVVKFVVKTAKTVGSFAGKALGAVLGPILGKLKRLISPLLRRVLSFAIGRLPASLQGPARMLASRIFSEAGEGTEAGAGAEAGESGEGAETGETGEQLFASPTVMTDIEAVTEQFDLALAEAIAAGPEQDVEANFLAERDSEAAADGRELELLAEARGALIDRLASAESTEQLGPAIEQFVPVLLGALRLGINLVGRRRVVNFLAGYLAKLIGQWVGPTLSAPLSTAIVDTGLRLISLEQASPDERLDEAVPVMLAAVIEDTVRHLTEHDSYVFENEELTQLAVERAFGRAVGTHFPPTLIKPPFQQAPSLAGAFVVRRPRSLRSYRKYSRTPEIELTSQVADRLPTFGGHTLGAAFRAAGVSFPLRVRVHIYESVTGTSLPRLARTDRALTGLGRVHGAAGQLHPLTTAAAGLLLREPGLGVDVPSTYLRSRRRIAVGQRFYWLQPIGVEGSLILPRLISGAAAPRIEPTQARMVIDLQRAEIRLALYLSEVEAQGVVTSIRQGRGSQALLQALTAAYGSTDRSFGAPQGRIRVIRELEDREGFFGRSLRRLNSATLGALRRRLRGWLFPAIAGWVRTGGEAFVRAAASPADGVTVLVTLRSVPGLDVLRQALSGRLVSKGDAGRLWSASRGAPTATFTVVPGRARP
jgi:hypothetical protein